jgi:hypothetical protein
MVRTVIIPKSANINLPIPKEYVGKPIEVTCLALEELELNDNKTTMEKFWNVISDETAEVLYQGVEQNRKEW